MVCIVSQNEIKRLVNTTHDSYPGNELKIPINKKKNKNNWWNIRPCFLRYLELSLFCPPLEIFFAFQEGNIYGLLENKNIKKKMDMKTPYLTCVTSHQKLMIKKGTDSFKAAKQLLNSTQQFLRCQASYLPQHRLWAVVSPDVALFRSVAYEGAWKPSEAGIQVQRTESIVKIQVCKTECPFKTIYL